MTQMTLCVYVCVCVCVCGGGGLPVYPEIKKTKEMKGDRRKKLTKQRKERSFFNHQKIAEATKTNCFCYHFTVVKIITYQKDGQCK